MPFDSMTMLPNVSTNVVGTRLGGFALVLVIHVIIVAVLLQPTPARLARKNGVPIVVSLIEPERKPEPPPPLVPPKRVVTTQRVVPPTVASPPPVVPPPAPAAPSIATVESVITTTPEPVTSAAVPSPIPAPPAPPPFTPPSFNARYLQNPPPAYPPVSRKVREEGKVILRVFVSESGLPVEVDIRTSSGHPRLDDTAVDTVRRWRFVPARRGEQPVSAWVLVPISFTLKG